MEPILRVEELSVSFGGLKAVQGASMQIAAGEIHGLIGPNGAGKTTFFNAISGLVPAASGRIVLDGTPLSNRPAHERAASGICRTFQSVQLIQGSTVIENVLIGMHSKIQQRMIDLLFGSRVSESVDYKAQCRAYEILDLLSIADLGLRRVASLTFAQQRRVEIARALVGMPKLLMLDEPAAGLSPGDVDELEILLRNLSRARGLSILVVEHVLSLVFNLCDRITVLDGGRVIAEGTATSIAGNEAVQRAYLGDGEC
jgi:branched-chain amino acid transport system ATP-binding protein